MTCANCVSSVERNLKKVEGVEVANVNLTTERAAVEYDPSLAGLDSLLAKIERAGYGIAAGEADLVISPYVPQGFLGEELAQVNFIAVAHPEHVLHKLDRDLTMHDLNRETHVLVSDSGSKGIDAGWLSDSRRWAVTSLDSARKIISNGMGFGWLPENEIDQQINNGELKTLRLKEGLRNTGILYLVYADLEQAGPATKQLAEILKRVSSES